MKKPCFAGILLFLLSAPVFAAAPLAKPVLMAPKEAAVFDIYPRTADLSWKPVPGAAKYCVEIQWENRDPDAPGGQLSWQDYPKQYSKESHFHLDNFVGAQRGRWRVTAIDASGVSGESSEWRTFRFTK